MNIKNRLILSHILTFFIPIVMTFFVLLLCAGGLALFAQSGHHIYAENVNQFQRITMVLHHVVFRNLRSHPDGNLSDIWLLGLLDPDYNCIMVNREGQVIYTYGNQFLAKETTPDIKQVMASLEQGSRGVRYASSPKKNYFMEKQVVKGRVYTLHYFNQIAPPASDEVFEQALHLTEFVCALSLLAFILLSSWFLSRFVLHHIIPPLKELQHASERIQEGDLGVRIGHGRQDEFRPVVDAFNLMAVKLQDSLNERERQEENRKELIASISHDIRTPLTAIKAYVEGLKDNVASTPEKRKQYLDVIDHKTEDLNRMVEQLFLLSKIDLGERAVPMKLLDLGQTLRTIASENDLHWQQAGAAVKMAVPETPVFIRGSTMLLERILQNLVSNSAKYRTLPEAEVHCHLAVEDGRAVLHVWDNGPGVPEQLLHRLTDPFFRTDKARSHTADGSGIGLTIVARSMAVMQGTLQIENVTPNGLSFTMTFPLAKEE